LTPQPLITIRNLTKSYPTSDGNIEALSAIDLDIAEAEFVSVLGPSGCGKSTLLMIIAGLLPATSGSVCIGGQDVRRPYTNLGIVFQQDLLLDWRNVLDNVLLQTEIRGLKRSEYEPRAQELLQRVGLSRFLRRFPKELSGGMRQRVSICRALVHSPSLLLMDEPFGALDALTRDQMNLDLLHIWDRRRMTVFFVTHSIPEAIFLGDRVLVMSARPGCIVESIPIDLPRPRHLHMRDTPEFGRYNRHIRELFQQQGILVDAPDDAPPGSPADY
jgi:NitT/TauT family transport system ATP-binding protein